MKQPENPPRLTRNELLDKLAAECVEEILWETGREGGRTWFSIIREKLEKTKEEKP